MEVHAHTSRMSGTRKKWSHYLWEFLMLFLAVFCGFLAENFREHKVEIKRGRQYIKSFYEDLKTDTSRFSVIISSFEKKSEVFKSMPECFDGLVKDNENVNCLSSLFEHSQSFLDLVYTDGTMQQLKNAGGFRLLHKEDVDSILAYDNLLRIYIKSETSGFQDRQDRLRDIIYSLMNYKIPTDNSPASIHPLYKRDMETINKYFVMLNAYANAILWFTDLLRKIKARAISLIEYFKERYHLK